MIVPSLRPFGARARRLAVPGAGPDTVHYLRSFGEAEAMRRRLSPGSRLVVIGGGFIGLELAAAARARGAEATVIEMAPRLLGRAVPADLAAAQVAKHIEGAVLSEVPRDNLVIDVVLGNKFEQVSPGPRCLSRTFARTRRPPSRVPATDPGLTTRRRRSVGGTST